MRRDVAETDCRPQRQVTVHWFVFSADEQRAAEARASAARILEGAQQHVEVKAFRDGFFPYVGYDVKQYFEELKRRCSPDLIFTHYREDRHQDHRLISDLDVEHVSRPSYP